MMVLTGHTAKIGHFLQPIAMATGQSVIMSGSRECAEGADPIVRPIEPASGISGRDVRRRRSGEAVRPSASLEPDSQVRSIADLDVRSPEPTRHSANSQPFKRSVAGRLGSAPESKGRLAPPHRAPGLAHRCTGSAWRAAGHTCVPRGAGRWHHGRVVPVAGGGPGVDMDVAFGTLFVPKKQEHTPRMRSCGQLPRNVLRLS